MQEGAHQSNSTKWDIRSGPILAMQCCMDCQQERQVAVRGIKVFTSSYNAAELRETGMEKCGAPEYMIC